MIDLNIQLCLRDAHRQFELDACLQTDADFTVLYGASGSGKTTTLQAIAGLQRPGSGHIRVGDEVFFDSRAGVDMPARQRRIGYLFQQYALFPHLTVRANVQFGLTQWYRRRPTPAQRERVDGLLESFGLSTLADSRPRTLSGGQQQRVALARALACEPRLLLLDEPFAALNAMLRDSLRAELAATCRQWQVPVLMISHDLEDVMQLAQTAFVYEAGRIVKEIDVGQAKIKHSLPAMLGQHKAENQPEDARRAQLRGLLMQ